MNVSPRVVLHTPEPGSGAGRYLFELTRALAAHGCESRLLAPDNFEYRAPLAEDDGIEFVSLGMRANETDRGLANRMLDNLRFVLGACRAQLQATRRAQVIHFQFPLHLPFGLAPFLLAKLRGMRIVFTAHDPLPHKWLFPAPWNRLERWSLASIYKLSDRIIVHSTAGFKTLVREFGVPSAKLQIVPHGPFAVPSLPTETLPSDRLRVLLFGSLRENKGIHLAIAAVNNLALRGVPVHLTIAGETPNGKEEAYWSTCQQMLTNSSVAIELQKRYIPETEVPSLLANAHCLLLPYTNFSSDSGIAALALSNGKPIIATGSGGLGELLNAAELGIRIEETTIAGVEKALETAWTAGGAELARLGRSGADYLLNQCSWQRAAEKTAAVYQQLLSRQVVPAEPLPAASKL